MSADSPLDAIARTSGSLQGPPSPRLQARGARAAATPSSETSRSCHAIFRNVAQLPRHLSKGRAAATPSFERSRRVVCTSCVLLSRAPLRCLHDDVPRRSVEVTCAGGIGAGKAVGLPIGGLYLWWFAVFGMGRQWALGVLSLLAANPHGCVKL